MKGVLGNDDGWSILFALTVIPGIFQVPKILILRIRYHNTGVDIILNTLLNILVFLNTSGSHLAILS